MSNNPYPQQPQQQPVAPPPVPQQPYYPVPQAHYPPQPGQYPVQDVYLAGYPGQSLTPRRPNWPDTIGIISIIYAAGFGLIGVV